jgi:tRNA(Ile)-lysidine synthase
MGIRDDIVAYVEQTVQQCVDTCRPEGVLVAVSGGADSVAMLLALHALRETCGLRLVVGHVNHGLRGPESDGDEEFVRGLAGDLHLPVEVERVEVVVESRAGREGLEATARRKRFLALRGMAAAAGLNRIAVGHTATDRAETVLMNILRGSGLEGLAAMRQVAGDLIRPMLLVSREQSRAYCEAKGVVPRSDSSNLDQSILRNRIRLSLMPLLERDYQPGAARSLLRLAEIVEGELEWTKPIVQETYAAAAVDRGGAVALDLGKLQQMPRGLRRRVIRRVVARVRGDVQDLGLEHSRALDDMVVSGGTGQRLELPGLRAERTSRKVVLDRPRKGNVVGYCVSMAVPGTVGVGEAGIELASVLVPLARCDPARRGPYRAHLDAAVVGRELVVRSPRAGDRMAPLGMRGTKKLQDLFVDCKVPRAEREGIPVVTTTDGEIVWVVGHRISERAKVTAQTEFVAELEARPLLEPCHG